MSRTSSIDEWAKRTAYRHYRHRDVRQISDLLRIIINIDDVKTERRLWTQEISGGRSDLLALERRLHEVVDKLVPTGERSAGERTSPWRSGVIPTMLIDLLRSHYPCGGRPHPGSARKPPRRVSGRVFSDPRESGSRSEEPAFGSRFHELEAEFTRTSADEDVHRTLLKWMEDRDMATRGRDRD